MSGFEIISTGDKEVVARLDALTDRVTANLARAIGALLVAMTSDIRNKLNGPVLNRRTGALQNSIRQDLKVSAQDVTGTIGAGKGIPYAAIHEFGGTTKPHDIRPKGKTALAFTDGYGGTIFARVVHHPGSKMPERSYMRSTLADWSDRITRTLAKAVSDGAAS
jgi:phage gpG-like protein